MLSYVVVFRVIKDKKKTSARLFSGGGHIRNSLFYVHESHGLILKIYFSKCPECLWDTWPWCIPRAARGWRACHLLLWGAAAACMLRMLGLNPAANISRNVLEGWLQCYVGDVA